MKDSVDMISPTGKHPGGRPSKLTPSLAVKIFALARKGLTDKEIAAILNLNESTLTLWKRSPEFFTSLKEAKAEANALIERSLFERALGYECSETKVFCHNGKIIKAEVTKHYPPDPASMIFWLKNREPAKWREKIESPDNIADSVSSVLQLMRRHEENKVHQGSR